MTTWAEIDAMKETERKANGLCDKCKTAKIATPEEGAESQPEYAGLCETCSWMKWFSSAGKGWESVNCIECELGRSCLKTPPCSGAEVDE